jgi:hypothetical protein
VVTAVGVPELAALVVTAVGVPELAALEELEEEVRPELEELADGVERAA